MRAMTMSVVALVLSGSGAVAQTAEFKCPKAGTTTERPDGGRTVWTGQEGNFCRRTSTDKSGQQAVENWYAPTLWIRADRSQAYVDQVKPWTLWPLTVGKRMTARFDGVGNNPGFGQGSWIQTITVDSYERLKTPAGTFDVFVVTRTEEALSHKYRSTLRQWYAPDLGMPVRTTFSDNDGRNQTFETSQIHQ